MYKKTKIGATIGPACESVDVLVKMVKSGMNFARLNFSHGTYENHSLLIKNLRETEKLTGEPVAIMQDLQGPKIRVGALPDGGINIAVGKEIVFNTSLDKYKGEEIPIDYSELHNYLKNGERILVDDGRVEVKIKEIKGSKIYCEVIEGNIITSHKGLNLPDSKLTIAALSEKDKNDLKFGVKMCVDVVAISFVQSAKDILDVRFLIRQFEQELKIVSDRPIAIIAKIERYEAVNNIKEIIDAADGIMVARGDLGLEMEAAVVPLVQKKIIDMANAAAKPVIVATQMLDSMRTNRRPTRAEVSDVSNAVIDHADGLLLTNETAAGKHPVLTVKTMSDIILATEKSSYDDMALPLIHKHGTSVQTAVSELSRILAEEVKAEVILAASLSGETGRMISHVRPQLSILVATGSDRVRRQLNLSWGVRPFILVPCNTIEELVERALSFVKKNKLAKTGDKMIVVAGEPVGQAGNVNLVEVREIK